ncbi:MAG: DUF1761 domain-containing protein [Candidatus Saccharibacteria bacterium]
MIGFIINNWLSILLSSSAGIIVSALWYSDYLFGKEWRNLAKLKNTEDLKSPVNLLIMLLVIFITALVLKRFIIISNPLDYISAIKLAIWLWLGFVATYAVGEFISEKRPMKLLAIDVSNSLVVLVIMSVILYRIN